MLRITQTLKTTQMLRAKQIANISRKMSNDDGAKQIANISRKMSNDDGANAQYEKWVKQLTNDKIRAILKEQNDSDKKNILFVPLVSLAGFSTCLAITGDLSISITMFWFAMFTTISNSFRMSYSRLKEIDEIFAIMNNSEKKE